jgi:hypothetical protein
MKIYYLQMKAAKGSDFIRFCIAYNISIFITWAEDDLFNGRSFFVTVTNQPDNKITAEEKARLIEENELFKIIKIETL